MHDGIADASTAGEKPPSTQAAAVEHVGDIWGYDEPAAMCIAPQAKKICTDHRNCQVSSILKRRRRKNC